MVAGPLALVIRMAGILDELGVTDALGGSMASSLLGEPRSTVEVDLAIRLDAETGEQLLARVEADFLRSHRLGPSSQPRPVVVQPGGHQRVEGAATFGLRS